MTGRNRSAENNNFQATLEKFQVQHFGNPAKKRKKELGGEENQYFIPAHAAAEINSRGQFSTMVYTR
jgi:hypothetical protein